MIIVLRVLSRSDTIHGTSPVCKNSFVSGLFHDGNNPRFDSPMELDALYAKSDSRDVAERKVAK
jgi:hypothetical protein